jgi:uncharacterized membrane protein
MTGSQEGHPSNNSRRILLSMMFVAAAAAIRCFHLESQGLWNDEMFSFEVANLPLGEIQSSLIAHFHHPPLFFYLLHFVLLIFGQHAWALRFIPAASGSLTVGLVYYCSSKLLDDRAGIAAGLLCLVAPFHLAYSQEGRPYALAGLLALMSYWSLLLVVREQKIRWMTCYVLTSIALLATHHWGIFVLASEVVFIMLFAKYSVDLRKKFILMWIVVGILYLPEAVGLFEQSTTHDRAGWFWVDRPDAKELLDLGLAYSGTYFKMASSVFDSPLIVKAVGGAAMAILCCGLVFAAAGRAASTSVRAAVVVLCGTLGIPLAISFVRPEIFLWYRYTVIVFPLFCLGAGALASASRWKAVMNIAVSVLVLLGLYGSVRYFSWSKSNVKDVAASVERAVDGGVRTIIRPKYFAPMLNYYYKGNARQLDEAYLDSPLGSIVDTTSSFVYVSLDVPNEIRDHMDQHFDKVAENRFPGEAHMGMVVGVYRQKSIHDSP